MTDLSDRGYMRVGTLGSQPVWEDSDGRLWVEHTAAMRHEFQNFHIGETIEHKGKAVTRVDQLQRKGGRYSK